MTEPQSGSLPERWRMPPRSMALRIFFTCWLVYAMHLATNIVREIYPALSLGDHFSFRVDEYAHMHPDLFEKPGYGWHIGNNPGASMLAAIPYALARPIIDPIVKSVKERREASGQTEPPAYDSPWPMAREFYAEAWRRGLDVKFGLAAFVMQAFCMAPFSAAAVMLLFSVLRVLVRSDRTAMWLSLLYAFGTPAFYRTGYLNHNLMLGHTAFAGLCVMWNPWGLRWSSWRRYFLGGVAGGMTLLFDYTGVIMLPGLFLYALVARFRSHGSRDAVRHGFAYFLGTLGPVFLLWFYQWRSFGNPFLPGQNWMPPVRWIELGYQGYGPPQLELFKMLLADTRFGLFPSCPLFLLTVAALFVDRGRRAVLPATERAAMLAISLALILFFSGSNYVRLQFNTGIRYLAPLFPFLFVPAAAVLVRIPRTAALAIGFLSVFQAWSMAMYRDVERLYGLLDPMIRFVLGGPQLPTLQRLALMEPFKGYFPYGPSSLGLFALAGAFLFLLWRQPARARDS